MKGRNSYNANAGNEYIDSNKLDGNFTPVNNRNKSVINNNKIKSIILLLLIFFKISLSFFLN
jgi:1,4-dihydroxy-2-naphthoate octaprenyltransferase